MEVFLTILDVFLLVDKIKDVKIPVLDIIMTANFILLSNTHQTKHF